MAQKKRRLHHVKKGLMHPQQSNSMWIFIAGMAIAGLVTGISSALATKAVNKATEQAKLALAME